jgi:O-antigen/teichoic acid export membrane protein
VTDSNHYSFTRVKRSLGYFAIGKIGSGLTGLGLLILVVRILPRAEYGTYVTYMALFEIVQLVSSLGVIPIAQRYVTDCRIRGSQRQLVKLVSWACLGRFITLLIACGGLYFLANKFLGFIGIPEAKPSFLVYLLVMLTEGVSRYLDFIFESLLLQGRGQASIFFRNFAKLCAFSAMVWFGGGLTLDALVKLEAMTSTGGLALAILLIVSHFWMQPVNRQVSAQHRRYAASDIAKFSLQFYLAQVIGQIYGGDAIKLITTRVLGIIEAASFGFSYSIYAILQRYLPAYLLLSMIRPLFIAKHTGDSNLTEINNMANMVFKLNMFCLTPLIAFLMLYGIQFSLMLSGGKYPDAGGVLVALCTLLIIQTLHLLLGLLAIATERAQSVLWGTILGMIGVFAGIYLAKGYGIAGLVAGLMISEILWCATVWTSFSLSGIRFRLDWSAIFKFTFISCSVVALFNTLNLPSSPKPLEMALIIVLMMLTFALLAYLIKPFNTRERALINRILPRPIFIW